MTARRFSRLQKATALIPLAILSAAWTASVTDLAPNPVAVATNGGINGGINGGGAGQKPATTLPDGSRLPATTVAAPASVTPTESSGKPVTTQTAHDIVANASTSGIPTTALAAYQRAATVINAADSSCHLDWPLLAAIGRVESNHGRYGGSHLATSGVATPAIIGIALSGQKHTARVADTDAGQYDGDATYDRAVGPMQFVPSTWAVVGVDADGDGKRDPQDINDAALAAAVYLCSGSDLSTLAGQREAVFRYNHSKSYVATVLGVAAAYRAGDYTAAPNSTVPTDQLIISDTTPTTVSAKPTASAKKAKSAKTGHRSKSAQSPAKSAASDLAAPAPTTPAKSTHSDTGSKQKGDTTKPAAPVIASLPGPTNDATPTISGTGEPKATVTLTIAGTTTLTVGVPEQVESDGTWSFTFASPLGDGDYAITATQSDAAGNVSAKSDPVTLTVDTTAPDAPTIIGSPTDGDTTLRGTVAVEPGATFTVAVNGKNVPATIDSDGTWTVDLAVALSSDDTITAIHTDKAGNSSVARATVAAPTESPSPSPSAAN